VGVRRWPVAVLIVLLAATPALAAKTIALGEVHSESDVADEAAAITLLVWSSLAGSDTTLAPLPADMTLLNAPPLLTKQSLQFAVVMELTRRGTGLRLLYGIVGADGSRDIGYVDGGDGDVQKLADGVVQRTVDECKLAKRTTPAVELGSLRPYASALRLRRAGADASTSAAALADAIPVTALTASGIRTLLGPLPAEVTDPTQAAVAAYALRDAKRLAELGAGTDAAATGARALAALVTGNRQEAEQVLGAKPPRHGLVTIVQAALADTGSDTAVLEARIKSGIVSDQVRPVLAIASTLVHTRVSSAVHRALLAAVEKQGSAIAPGVASRIGLHAAEAGVELPRALALVQARELEAFELQRLDALVNGRTDAVGLRLRAELAMRRADGLEAATIGEYVKVAPTEARARRYQGWVLAGEGKHAEAAVELGKAGAVREQIRAHLAAGDPKAALAVVGTTPVSAEDHVVVVRVALLEKRPQDATDALARAEKLAPLNPVVHEAVVAIDPAAPNPQRLAVAKTVLEKTTGVKVATTAVAAGSADEASTSTTPLDTQPTIKLSSAGFDPALLEPLLSRLDGLTELRKRTLVIARVRWEPPWTSFQVTQPELVEATLVKALSAPPYKLKLARSPAALPTGTPKAERLAELTGDADGLLLYGVVPTDRGAEVQLSFYARDATELSHVSGIVKAPGLVAFNSSKLRFLLVFAGVLLVGLIVYITRAKGTITLKITRAPDVIDEALCAEVTKSPARPRVEDPAKFIQETRKAGSVHTARSATLIVSGQKFRVGVGHWYVHLYGAFSRAGKALVVPSSCTQELVVERGKLTELEFNLTSKLAEVRVEIIDRKPRGIAVWVVGAEHDKAYTDDAGIAILELPLGTHTLKIETRGRTFEQPLQISAPKQHRVSFNVERELRLEQSAKLDVGAEQGGAAEVDNPAPTSTPPHAHGIGAARTTPLPASMAAAPAAPVSIAIGHGTAATAYASSLAASAAPAPLRAHPRAQTPRPGDKLLGRYRIKAELGRGAMGVVHRAWDEKLEREVAIKEMADDLRTNPEAMRLFEQEAKALAQLNHTNIVAMYDQITDETGVYMIMEFVDGKPLADIAHERGALPWREAVGIVDQVCTGLAYAHARKVIHRDIKPANCFVASDRTVKLGDFGLARVMREVTIRRTEIRGTPLYMAPEQITGTNVDHRADLYAVGCMLFELLTGRPPFVDGDILYAQMHLPPPHASNLASDIPAGLDDLLAALLAKQADDRPGSANEVRTALKQLYPS
jgi:tRNA A-37 threonylcarbamoyl transferase component Bud32